MRTGILLLLAALAYLPPSQAADTHPFSVHDMLAMDRISGWQVSPDGKRVAFSVSTTDLEANLRRSDLYLANIDGSEMRRLTNHPASDAQPCWSRDGENLFFISSRTGSQQVWRLALDGGKQKQITDLPLNVDALKVSPDGKYLVFSMAVFPGKSPEETKKILDEKKKSKAGGMIYDRLFVRHWDTWENGTHNHLFVYPLPSGPARDVMQDMTADCPGKPFGGVEEFNVTPDNRAIVFAAKDAGREEAWSTDFDLFLSPINGSAPPKKITANPAWDTQPVFSPDGKTLAYLAMNRAGYESDRFKIILRDWEGGGDRGGDRGGEWRDERAIELRADESSSGDRSPGDLVWSTDGKTLYCTADHLGQHSIFAVNAASGKTSIVIEQGTTSCPLPLKSGGLPPAKFIFIFSC